MRETPSIAAVLQETQRLSLGAWKSAAAIWLILVGTYALAELTLGPDVIGFAYGALGLLSLYLQLFLTSAALSCALPDFKFEWQSPTNGRFPAIFLLSLLWLFGVVAGLALLIVPGLVLLVRWTLSVPILLAEDTTAAESLRRSWHLTQRHWKVATLVFVLGFAPLVPAVAIDLQYPADGPPPISMALVTNILFATASVLSWLMFCALYALITSQGRNLSA